MARSKVKIPIAEYAKTKRGMLLNGWLLQRTGSERKKLSVVGRPESLRQSRLRISRHSSVILRLIKAALVRSEFSESDKLLLFLRKKSGPPEAFPLAQRLFVIGQDRLVSFRALEGEKRECANALVNLFDVSSQLFERAGKKDYADRANEQIVFLAGFLR